MTGIVGNLRIDPEFKQLIPPLSTKEYKQLESNIKQDGCRDPICVWNGVILDGHNRYGICQRHGISFRTMEIRIANRDAAIAWICATQIGRRNINEETRKYLIGKRYEAEKRLGPPNTHGHNQCTKEVAPATRAQPTNKKNRHTTAAAIAKDYNLCPTTVQQYGRYAKAVDQIGAVEDKLASRVLSGEVKVSMSGVFRLAQMPNLIIKQACEELTVHDSESLSQPQMFKILSQYEEKSAQSQVPSVKDMPDYDPDAEVNSLTYTIPSWRNSLCRMHSSVKIEEVSLPAKTKLITELYKLAAVSEQLAVILKGV